MTATLPHVELDLAREIGAYVDDPLGFVRFAYPWRQPGPLEKETGPDTWQAEFLRDVGAATRERRFNGVDAVAPLRFAVSSGHGIGKSVLVAWLVDWIMSTRPGCRITVTANTVGQLETKTWPAIDRWTRLLINASWFSLGAAVLRANISPKEWFCVAQTCREENSEAFAGQHAKTSTSAYIKDEASAIPDSIWEVSEGGLTDGEPMIFAFGNPTRNTGKFHQIVFGSERHRWNQRCIDSRTSRFTNKAQIQEWIQDYGEDSDFVRVRVRGLAPRASETQFIDTDRVEGAQRRAVEELADQPLVAGVDVSGGGSAWNVVRFRRGLDARNVPAPLRLPGSHGQEREQMIAQLARILEEQDPAKKVRTMFVDSAFGAPIVERLHVLGFSNVVEVNFGGKSPDPNCGNWRAAMWHDMKEWLMRGAIDKNDKKLAVDLVGPGFHMNVSNKLIIESKELMAKRGVPSPDDGDALALTFAAKVAPVRQQVQQVVYTSREAIQQGWMA